MHPALVQAEIEAAKRKPPDRIAGRVAALHKEIGRFQHDLALFEPRALASGQTSLSKASPRQVA